MKNKILFVVILAAALLGLFFLTRYGMPALYTPEWSARNIFWVSAMIIFSPALYGKYKFSITALAGYITGMIAGELFGGFESHVPPQYKHHGWLILILVFSASCLLGAFVQRKKNNREP